MKMRFNRETELIRGDERIITKYLYLPLRLPLKDYDDNRRTYETRWLEQVKITQRYDICSDVSSKWYNICWNDNG